MTIGLSHLHAPSYKIRLFAFPSEISQRIFAKIHCENAEFGSLRDPGLLQVFNLQQLHLFLLWSCDEVTKHGLKNLFFRLSYLY